MTIDLNINRVDTLTNTVTLYAARQTNRVALYAARRPKPDDACWKRLSQDDALTETPQHGK